MEDVLDHAHELGLRVAFRDLGRREGELHSSGLIIVNSRRTHMTQRIAIAHEIGHHVHGHHEPRDHWSEQDERQADIYAAGVLIRVEDYRYAEGFVGSHPGALARELGCLARHVAYWQQHHQRRGTFLRVARDVG
jgi:hypothetical protein